mmetsp:Transcript_36228/g.108561  ORF Transcript_36228/g.108561 Transcript_36228/m.108561 type:complete len:111 (-) Transcript_36228:281-613(-)
MVRSNVVSTPASTEYASMVESSWMSASGDIPNSLSVPRAPARCIAASSASASAGFMGAMEDDTEAAEDDIMAVRAELEYPREGEPDLLDDPRRRGGADDVFLLEEEEEEE